MLSQLKSSAQTELDNFFSEVYQSPTNREFIKAPSFFKARKQLKHSAFIEMNEHILKHYDLSSRSWKGFRLLAIDGSKHNLPDYPDLIKEFGCATGNHGNSPQISLSQMYDVLNKVTLHAVIEKKETSERDMALRHLHMCPERSLILFDRGYPGYWFMQNLIQKGHHFCMRADQKNFKIVNELLDSNDIDRVVTLDPRHEAVKMCRKMDLPFKPFKVRLIKVFLESNVTEVLMTSLLDQEEYETDLFQDLYHQRWLVEEDFKVLKSRMEIGNLTGKSAEFFRQDYFAKIVTKNINAIMNIISQEIAEGRISKRKLDYQINRNQSLKSIKQLFAWLLKKSGWKKKIILQIEDIAKKLLPKRPGRSNERNNAGKGKRKYHVCYK